MNIHITSTNESITINAAPEYDEHAGEIDPRLSSDALDRVWSIGASVDAICELLDLAFVFCVGDEIEVEGFTYRLG